MALAYTSERGQRFDLHQIYRKFLNLMWVKFLER